MLGAPWLPADTTRQTTRVSGRPHSRETERHLASGRRDGAAAATGRLSGFPARGQEVASERESAQTAIHRTVPAGRQTHLNLTSPRMRSRRSSTGKRHPRTRACVRPCSPARRRMRGTPSSLTHRRGGVLRAGRQPGCLGHGSRPRGVFQEVRHHWQHVSVTQNGSKNSLTRATCSTCSRNSTCPRRGEDSGARVGRQRGAAKPR